MPFSSDGDTIDFIYGVINWKNVGEAPEPARVIKAARPPLPPETDDDEDEVALTMPVVPRDEAELGAAAAPHLVWEGGPHADADPAFAQPDEPAALDGDAALADRLAAARDSAEICKAADGRSRGALYRALALAHDFAIAARRVPAAYAEILDDAGIKAQARADDPDRQARIRGRL